MECAFALPSHHHILLGGGSLVGGGFGHSQCDAENAWQKAGEQLLPGGNETTALLVLTALYFTVKWAVKNGVKEAFQEMKETEEAHEEDDRRIRNRPF